MSVDILYLDGLTGSNFSWSNDMLFELKVRGSNTSGLWYLVCIKALLQMSFLWWLTTWKGGIKWQNLPKVLLNSKNSKMKLSSTILSYFSATHGFNPGMSQTVWTRKKGNGLDTGLQNTVSVWVHLDKNCHLLKMIFDSDDSLCGRSRPVTHGSKWTGIAVNFGVPKRGVFIFIR